MKKPIFYFDAGTPDDVSEVLSNIYISGVRVRIFFGNKETGLDWCQEYDTMGYIGRSTGWKPCPILIHNKRSRGGRAILTAAIVKITMANDPNKVIYRHPTYHIFPQNINLDFKTGHWDVGRLNEDCLWERVARFDMRERAQRFKDFIEGRRNTK